MRSKGDHDPAYPRTQDTALVQDGEGSANHHEKQDDRDDGDGVRPPQYTRPLDANNRSVPRPARQTG